MPLLECENHHLFNGDKYGTICPRCGLNVAVQKEDVSEKSPEELYVQEQERACGWIVCIKGHNKGRAYVIHHGKNFIGSSNKMNIQILGDKRIDEHNHAVIVYESKERKTLLIPGDSSGMVYCQEKAVYAPTELEPFNIIELGVSQFVYVPLCGAGFAWEDYKD